MTDENPPMIIYRNDLPAHFICGHCKTTKSNEQMVGTVMEVCAMGDLWALLPVCHDCRDKGDIVK